MTTEMATRPAEDKRELALLKAVGLDRAAPEQRELAINIAGRYELDLLLKHIVLIDGRPYITRDALLFIAHRSGQFDGIEVTTPEVVGDEWRCTATVWRKDFGHPFVYGGRYPTKGGNQKFAPEMAIKVAESMALRRAFNVAAPVVEERWDLEQPEAAEPPPPKPALAEIVAEKAAAVEPAVTTNSIDAITADEFKVWYEAAHVDEARALEVAKLLFPHQKGLLTDAQRFQLKTALEAEAATEPLGLV